MGRAYTFFVGFILTGLGLATRFGMPYIQDILQKGSDSGVDNQLLMPFDPQLVEQSTLVFIGIGSLAMGYALITGLFSAARKAHSWRKKLKGDKRGQQQPGQQQPRQGQQPQQQGYDQQGQGGQQRRQPQQGQQPPRGQRGQQPPQGQQPARDQERQNGQRQQPRDRQPDRPHSGQRPPQQDDRDRSFPLLGETDEDRDDDRDRRRR